MTSCPAARTPEPAGSRPQARDGSVTGRQQDDCGNLQTSGHPGYHLILDVALDNFSADNTPLTSEITGEARTTAEVHSVGVPAQHQGRTAPNAAANS